MTTFDGGSYQARFDALAAGGFDVHGEATFVRAHEPKSVLDAGCGTGRVAIELARHGIETVGVDMDASMIGEARRRAPELEWVEADLCTLDLVRTFDVVVLAGNVPLFTAAGSQDALVRACCRHVAPRGWLITGFQLGRGYELADYDASCAAEGLGLQARYATWEGAPFDDGDYAVSVHQRS